MKLYIVGLGPGAQNDMTGRARAALEECDLIAGYTVYVDLVRDMYPDKEVLTTPMRKEVDRCRAAIEAAASGRTVTMVCSGDPGVYGMAGLCYELAVEYPPIDIEVVPGISAANGGAAVLGAPLMHDYAIISLSDLLTPWEAIEARLDAAARSDYLQRACDILLRSKSPQTVCGFVRNIGRIGEEAHVTTLGELRDTKVDMFTTVFIGNSRTREIDGMMVTPRGYLGASDATRDTAAKPVDGTMSGDVLEAALDARKPVLVFGGTAEGRTIVEWLARHGANVVACSATEYGGSLLPEGPSITSIVDRLDEPAMCELMKSQPFACVVDATHPYAAVVSENVREAAAACELDLLRIVRDGDVGATGAESWRTAVDVEDAARIAGLLPGNILLTTGSKDLETFVRDIPDFADRVYARILPVADSVTHALELGIPASRIVAMQGPFSRDLNEALIRALDIAILVTKASGGTGGFWEKVEAANACNVELVVIDRPVHEEGLTLDEALGDLMLRLAL